MKYPDYPSLFISLLSSAYPKSEEIYKKLRSVLRSDFYPPFERSALFSLTLSLFLLSFEEKDKILCSALKENILSLNSVESKNYASEDFCAYIKRARSLGGRGGIYISCLRSLLDVISSRI